MIPSISHLQPFFNFLANISKLFFIFNKFNGKFNLTLYKKITPCIKYECITVFCMAALLKRLMKTLSFWQSRQILLNIFGWVGGDWLTALYLTFLCGGLLYGTLMGPSLYVSSLPITDTMYRVCQPGLHEGPHSKTLQKYTGITHYQ